MRFIGLGGRFRGLGSNAGRGRPSIRAKSSSNGSSQAPSSTMSPFVKSAITSGTMCAAGDILAQTLARHFNKDKPDPYDFTRTTRMAGWGYVFYGPYQHWWYGLLDKSFGAKTTANFLTKVALNQVVLGPIVSATVFAWTLAFQNKLDEFPDKMKRDWIPTILSGWKFWVPASAINFKFIPLRFQVLYMSTCGLLWTGFLSFSSNTQVVKPAEPPLEDSKGKKKSK